MNRAQVKGLLGLCARAGQIVLGTDQALKLVRRGGAACLLVDGQAAENTKKKLRDASLSHASPLYELPAGLLDEACGQSGRMGAALREGTLSRQLITLLEPANQ